MYFTYFPGWRNIEKLKTLKIDLFNCRTCLKHVRVLYRDVESKYVYGTNYFAVCFIGTPNLSTWGMSPQTCHPGKCHQGTLFSKHRPSGPMLSISWFVHMCVCLSMCLSLCLSVCSLLRYRLNNFLPPLLEVRCPQFLEIQNPWGKVMERSGLRFEHFCLEVV